MNLHSIKIFTSKKFGFDYGKSKRSDSNTIS